MGATMRGRWDSGGSYLQEGVQNGHLNYGGITLHPPWSSPLLGAEEKGLVDWRTRVRGVTMYGFNPTFQWLSSILS